MKPENAVATSFSTIPLKTLQRNIEPKFVNFNSKQISSIYNRYMDAVSVTNRIDSILYGPERDLYSLSKDEKILLEDLNVEYNNAQNLYAEAAKECFIEGNLCVIPTVKRTAIIWPRPAEISSCSFYQKKALELGAITQLQYQHFLRLGIAPVPFIGSWNTYGQVSCDKLEE